ncbi:hypothetical protein F7R20_18750 [Pseudomonas brassicacearum subsp. brassicacearum]|nr:hypothetical protein F7R20_18750 [Pseudomonas brassicacearum subsp. brassicacearum]
MEFVWDSSSERRPKQARSHKGFASYTDPVWERACSRRRRHIQHQRQLIHRDREQARSHIREW